MEHLSDPANSEPGDLSLPDSLSCSVQWFRSNGHVMRIGVQ